MRGIPGRVSILICTLNRSQLSVRAIRSALDQTYRDVEVIVSDDASTDDTAEQIAKIADSRLKVFLQPARLGIVENPNFGLRQATGEFFMFLGDDDVLLPTAIERLVTPFLESLQGGRTVGAVWCPVQVADRGSHRFWSTERGPVRETTPVMLAALFAGKRGPRCSSILLRTADALAVGGYEPKYGDLSDIGNWGRAALRSDDVVCIPEPLVQYTLHAGSTTSRSSVEAWQAGARTVHGDMIAMLRWRGDAAGERVLGRALSDFVSGITLTILMQTVGKPGWVSNALREAKRYPRAFANTYFLRRCFKDGWKVVLLQRRARRARTAPTAMGAIAA